MLGFAGLSMSVTRSTRNATSAFRLLSWLGSEEPLTQLSTRSHVTLWCRKSQSRRSREWIKEWSDSGKLVAVINESLSGSEAFLLPRIPGIDQYLDSLESAVGRVLAEEIDAEEALAHSTEEWNAITGQYGLDQQRQAYRRHLGLEEVPAGL